MKKYKPLIIVALVIAGCWAFNRHLNYSYVNGLIKGSSKGTATFEHAIEEAQNYEFPGLERRAREGQAKEEEKYSVGSAIQMYRALGTKAANDRIRELEPYTLYEGTYVAETGETEDIFIGLREGKLYYTSGYSGRYRIYAPVGETLRDCDSLYECEKYLDIENMTFTSKGLAVSKSYFTSWSGTYLSEKSERYQSGDLSNTGYRETVTKKPKAPEINKSNSKPKLTPEERKRLKKQLEEENAREYDPGDYDDPEEFADDAVGVDYDDWDEAEDAWYDY